MFYSAQRLSASLESSLKIDVTGGLGAGRAQRLSASLESSQRPLLQPARGHTSAQRLSASLESSRAVAAGYPRGSACSTPFGIIGIFTIGYVVQDDGVAP